MPTIRIDDDVYAWLRSQAVPFEDTPNSVLRKMAGFDKRSAFVPEKQADDILQKEEGKEMKIATTKVNYVVPKRITGKYLADLWKVNVVHALYNREGKWYQQLREFPGALFDPFGYIVFRTENDYMNSPYLQHGIELHVPNGIGSVPGYKRMK